MSESRFISISELGEIMDILDKETPQGRRDYFEDPDTFFLWWFYYYPESFNCNLAEFHFEWLYYIACTDLDIMIEGFRSSLKTEITKLYIIRSICYKTISYCVWQSNDSDSSDESVKNISRMLTKSTLVADYGDFFPFEKKKEDFASSGSTNFDTTNGIKVKAKSTQEKIRGANIYDEDEGTERPDLLVLDDVDTTDSVRNRDIIDKNEVKLRQETIGAMSKSKARIIFLGNTIGPDGIVRRFAEKAKKDPRWKYFWQPLFDKMGNCVWPAFFTPDVIESIKSKEADAWDQNYMLIPLMTVGKTVFDVTQPFRIVEPYKIIEGFSLFQAPQDGLVIGVDIAEGGLKSDDSTLKARNKLGQTVFEFADQVDEIALAKKLDWILTDYYEERPKSEKKWKYLGTVLPERNVGRAFINECLRKRDSGEYVYWWAKFLLKARKLDGTEEEGIVQKYGFHTNEMSKQLIIREYRNALNRGEIDVSRETYNQMLTYQYDKNNSANAVSPYKDDIIIGDMIAHHGILHEPFVAEYEKEIVDIENLSPIQRHLHRLRNPVNEENFEYE